MTKDRFKNALRFKLVQRSVRDQGYQGQPDANEDDGSCSATAVNGDKVRTFAPLNEASRERLNEVLGVSNVKQGQTNAPTVQDLDVLRQQELEHDERQTGEAAKYGIFFDDRTYDYQRHLRVIGETPDAVFIPANASSRSKEIDLVHMFDDEELAGNDSLAAAAKDDPAVREVLEALEDEAYEDENFEDDFVVKLDRDGSTAVLCLMDTPPTRTGRHRWEENYGKNGRPHNNSSFSSETEEDEEETSESDDDQSLASRKGISYAASVAITSIDTKFDQIMRLYDGESDDISEMSLSFSDEEEHREGDGLGDKTKSSDDNHQRALGREEVEAALEDFLLTQRDYIRPSVEERKTGAVSLLNELRRELGPLPASILDRELSDTPDEDALEEMLGISSDGEDDHFDCQSIITTYTNTENLPGVVREPRRRLPSTLTSTGPVEIRISHRTGMPITTKECVDSDSEDEQATVEARGNKGEARNKLETAEEKRTRKAAVKEEKRQSRVAKKELRVRFQLGKEVPEAPASGGKSGKKPLKSILRA